MTGGWRGRRMGWGLDAMASTIRLEADKEKGELFRGEFNLLQSRGRKEDLNAR